MRIVLSVDGGPVSLGGDTVISDEGLSTQPGGAPMPTVYVPDVLLPNRCVCEDQSDGGGRVQDLSCLTELCPSACGSGSLLH